MFAGKELNETEGCAFLYKIKDGNGVTGLSKNKSTVITRASLFPDPTAGVFSI